MGGLRRAPTPYGGVPGYQPNPYAPTGPQLAAWPRRAIGGLVDFLAPGVVAYFIASMVGQNNTAIYLLALWGLQLGWWAYNSGYRLATTGYSIGQKLGKVRVVMEDTGQTPSQNTAIIRALTHILDALFCGLGFWFPLWDAKKQTFADKIHKTVVIDEQNR